MASNEYNLEPEFDALLKAHVQQRATSAVCHQFDPDEATAYLEQTLNKTALTSFEAHLVSCADCRRHVIELSHLMPSQTIAGEPLVVAPSFKERWHEWFSGWSLGAMAGIGAVAATVLLIAVVVNRSNQNSAPMVATIQREVQSTPPPEPRMTAYSSDEIKRAGKMMPAASPAVNAPLTDNQATAKTVPSATPALPAQTAAANEDRKDTAAPPPPAPPSLVNKTEFEGKEISQTKIAGQNQTQNLRAQTPAGPEGNQLQVDRALDRSRKNSEAQEKSAEAVVSEPAKPAPKAKEEKPSEQVVEKRRAELDEVAEQKKSKQRSTMPVSTAAASGSRGRVVGGKTFRQENGAWVDEAYDVNKGLPLVRLKRDSEAYKQTIKDNPGLKPYFDLKPVLVVWQGKVYRVEKE